MSQSVTSNWPIEEFVVPPPKKSTALSPLQVEGLIHVVRGVRVMLDEDIATLYKVPTKRLNEQGDRNIERFPSDFAFLLTQEEFANLKSQIATSSSAHGGRRKLPRAFTEHGIAMLSSVLRSEKAVQVNIELIRAFVRMRRLLATPGELATQIQQLAEAVTLHDHQITAINDVLRKMLEPPPVQPKRAIGFHTINHTPESNP
jgi:hypothetical protein